MTETLFANRDGMGHVVLNRPQVLNALSPSQFNELAATLRAWQRDPALRLVVIEGAGDRAFCAGGDIRAVWDARARGEIGSNRALFAAEYRLDRLIHHYRKPYVALLDGIVMGGGAGVSINGRYRVATERTSFAMPECAIGFFPDVGATHFLSRCPGNIGLYLGMTGTRLGAADCLWAGLATHYVPSSELAALKEALGRTGEDVVEVLAAFHRDPGPSRLTEQADWSWDGRQPIGGNAPFSLAITFRQLTMGKEISFDDAIRREYRLACRFLERPDFYEGIRALVVDKDKAPRWSPHSLAEVAAEHVEAMFAPLGHDELEFLTD